MIFDCKFLFLFSNLGKHKIIFTVVIKIQRFIFSRCTLPTFHLFTVKEIYSLKEIKSSQAVLNKIFITALVKEL